MSRLEGQTDHGAQVTRGRPSPLLPSHDWRRTHRGEPSRLVRACEPHVRMCDLMTFVRQPWANSERLALRISPSEASEGHTQSRNVNCTDLTDKK